jgi:hypothetical protein
MHQICCLALSQCVLYHPVCTSERVVSPCVYVRACCITLCVRQSVLFHSVCTSEPVFHPVCTSERVVSPCVYVRACCITLCVRQSVLHQTVCTSERVALTGVCVNLQVNNSRITEWIFTKFGIGKLYENFVD